MLWKKKIKKNFLLRVYNLARVDGLVRSQRDFAKAVGVGEASMSMAMGGSPKYLTSGLIVRVRLWAKEKGLQVEEPQQQDQQRGVFVPEELRAMFENMTETIKLQAQMLSAQQAAQQSHALGGYYTQKNYYRDQPGEGRK